jgi:hypothetical protein
MPNATSPSSELQLVKYAERLFAPLIREGVFENFERAFRALLLDYIDQQVAIYQEKIAGLELRHQQPFEVFTESLKGRATPNEEEARMDWEAARTFLSKWQRIRTQVVEDDGAAG